MQDDGDFVGIGDDVIIGYDISGRIDDKARAERGGLSRLSLRATALGHALIEEIPEEFLEWRARWKLGDFRSGMFTTAVGFERLGRRNVDHRGQQLCREISEAVGCGPSRGQP